MIPLLLLLAAANAPVPTAPRLVDAEIRVRYFKAKGEFDSAQARLQAALSEITADCAKDNSTPTINNDGMPACVPPPAPKPPDAPKPDVKK